MNEPASVLQPVGDTPTSIYGLVLAGGKSLRMGQDKGLLRFHDLPQREYIFQQLSACCQKVYTSCKTNQNLPDLLCPLPDRFTMEGPLNGILTAFALNPAVAWLTAPLDMPYIDRDVLRFLLANRNPTKLATCFFDSDGKDPEPLLALWEPAAAAPLLAYFNQGNKGVKHFLKNSDVHLVDAPDKKIHLNINSEDDLKRFFNRKS